MLQHQFVFFVFRSFSVSTRNSHFSDVLLPIDKPHENFCELPLFYFGTDGAIFSNQLKLPSVSAGKVIERKVIPCSSRGVRLPCSHCHPPRRALTSQNSSWCCSLCSTRYPAALKRKLPAQLRLPDPSDVEEKENLCVQPPWSCSEKQGKLSAHSVPRT